MRSPLSRPFAFATLVAYLLATTGLVGTHQHHHGLGEASVVAETDSACHTHTHCHSHAHGDRCCSHSHSHHHGSHDQSPAKTEPAGGSHDHCPGCPGHGPSDDENCAVCKLLSAKTLAPVQVTVVPLAAQVAELRLPAATSPTSAIQGLPLSRGPPSCG